VTAAAPKLARDEEPRTLSAGEIAAAIARPTDSAVVLTRVRHWTAQRLLLPIGEQVHTGVGKHRQYEPVAVIDAAVLNTLTEAGIQPAGREGPLLFALALTQAAYRDWTREPKARYLLELSASRTNASDKGSAFLHKLRKATDRPKPMVDAEVALLVDLNRIFARLPHELSEMMQAEDKARKGK
jgi:hypothetical protein